MLHHKTFAFALTLLALAAHAQTQTPEETTTQRITITGSSAPPAPSVAGFGDIPLSRSPFSATVIDQRQLRDAGISSLGDITRLDAGFTDAYNAPGYWNQVAVRGYTLDNRYNYRRDGLPINAETVIGSANKQRLEVLKGTSGLQAGTSSPGGLLNLVVKRPRDRIREAGLAWTQDGTLEAAADVGDRNATFGWRINASAAHLEPQLRSSRGHRWLAAAAFETRLGASTLAEAEFEFSRQSQPSTPGFSLLGDRLPDAKDTDPRINLNNQAWSLPVVLAGGTGSLRLTHTLADSAEQRLDLVAHAIRQRLVSDDRVAFPYGCSAENVFDRYCSDGSFDFYDFRSDNERRTSDAIDFSLQGHTRLAGLTHRFNAGVLVTRYKARLGDQPLNQAFNWVGVGTIDGQAVVPADPTLVYENTNRDERSTELHLQDAVELGARFTLWAGLRHTRLDRASVGTAGSEPLRYEQSVTTPWLALSHAIGEHMQVYASAGQGIETEVAPNRSNYANAGQALPALKSRQVELGLKHADEALRWSVALFDIRRPAAGDLAVAGGCAAGSDCLLRRTDGDARHRGVEAEAEWRTGALSLRGSVMWLRARREGSDDPSINGLRPTNVPARSIKLQAAYNVESVPGLAWIGFLTHEGQRMVLPDNSIATPGWTRIDLGARYTHGFGAQTLVWRLGIDNVADRRAWQEAPYQFGHAYLYPLAPRTAHASVNLRF